MPELWPFPPLIPSTETLEWLTDAPGGRTGEQRIALREAPRQQFEFSHRVDEQKFSRAKTFARRNAHLAFHVPVWFERSRIAGTILSTDTIIPVDTTVADYREGGFAVLWLSDTAFVVREITSVSSFSITLASAVGDNMTAPVIAPVREVFTPEGFRITRDGSWPVVFMKVQVVDNIDLSEEGEGLFPTYQSIDVLTDPAVIVSDISESIVRAAEYVDNGFGPVAIEPMKNYADFGQQVRFVDEGLAEIRRRRVWLHAIRGRQKAFWLPSFNMDLSLQATIGSAATTMTVRSIAPTGFYFDRHIMILLKDGTRFFRQITNVVNSGANDILTISSALGQEVTRDQIAVMCLLSKVRLNTDSVTFEHVVPGIARTDFPVVEVPA